LKCFRPMSALPSKADIAGASVALLAARRWHDELVASAAALSDRLGNHP